MCIYFYILSVNHSISRMKTIPRPYLLYCYLYLLNYMYDLALFNIYMSDKKNIADLKCLIYILESQFYEQYKDDF